MKTGWHIEKIGQVCTLMTGGTPSREKPEYFGGEIKWLVSGDIHQREIFDCDGRITEAGVRNSNAKLLPLNSVMIALNGQGKTRGTVALLRAAATCNQSLVSICPRNPERLLPEFLYLYLYSQYQEIRQMTGDSGNDRRGLNMDLIRGVEIPIAPVQEQQRIVGILDEAFEGIATAKANAEKNLQNARALFEGNLHSAFAERGKKMWVAKRLDEVCTFSSGGTPPKNNGSYWSGEIPWVSGRDMKSTRLSDSLLHISQSAIEASSTRLAPPGALLVLVRGMGLAHGAQIAELTAPCAFNQDIRALHPKSDILPRYLLFALRDRINSSDTALSNAAHGTLKIDSGELQSLKIPVPPLQFQQEIVATIDSLAEETQRLESIYQQKLAALEVLKKSLLHQAFAGKL